MPGNREKFLSLLRTILRNSSHAVIESGNANAIPTEDIHLKSMIALCDKIIVRGNPTLIDLDFEKNLFNGLGKELFNFKEITEGPDIGVQLFERYPNLIRAARILFCLPYQNSSHDDANLATLSQELRGISSSAEDMFLQQFNTEFNSHKDQIHRQVLIRDLVDKAPEKLAYSRVDFVFQHGFIKWIFEVDGLQHEEKGQRDHDQERDRLLKNNGWKTYRITTQEVHDGLQGKFHEIKNNLTELEDKSLNARSEYSSMQQAVADSKDYEAAYYSIVLPLAAYRCMHGLMHLYSYELLDSRVPQKILIVEEDIPTAVIAFHMLHAIWNSIHTLAPKTSPAPQLQLDVIGEKLPFMLSEIPDIHVRYISDPTDHYDLTLFHSFILSEGQSSRAEKEIPFDNIEKVVRFRSAIGFRSERSIQQCESLCYEVDDIEEYENQEKQDISIPTQRKIDSLLFFLRFIFRKKDFWEGQLTVISRLLQKKSSIVLLPTGGGKSLTYQLSGLLLPGITIIIDPLVALMEDQIDNLHASGIDFVSAISGLRTPDEKSTIKLNMEDGNFAFIFITPERLQIEEFRNALGVVARQFPISLAVIDEAHCVSEWGHSFRPSYLHMPMNLQTHCTDDRDHAPTLVGLTGTASFAVLIDIQAEMNIKDERAIISPKSFDRKELSFEVRKISTIKKPSELKVLKKQLPRMLKVNPQNCYELRGDGTNSGIIFCPHANGSLGVMDVAATLGHNNVYAGKEPKYHNGIDWDEYKTQIQEKFKNNQVQELVATNAFGMGIDKPNIRYTCHYAAPQSLEAFYQEAGRAGRNGKPGACCVILYSDDNWDQASGILREKNHQEALRRLKKISWNDRGDMLFQLWFLFNAYKGHDQDKKNTQEFWLNEVKPIVTDIPMNAMNTKELKYSYDTKNSYERAIFRLMLLGIIEDYTIDFRNQNFSLHIRHISAAQIKENLRQYFMKYKFEKFARDQIFKISEEDLETTIKLSIDILIDFIYDEIVVKRKESLINICELCRDFTSGEQFRGNMLSYLQDSEFTKELRKWLNQSYDDIGLDKIKSLLKQVETLEEAKRLVGTTRRMLGEDPRNIALRYLSTCARVRSSTESEESVLEEAKRLASQVDEMRDTLQDADLLLVSIFDYVNATKRDLLEKVGDIILCHAGTASLARKLLSSNIIKKKDSIYSQAMKLLTANALTTVKNCAYYDNLN